MKGGVKKMYKQNFNKLIALSVILTIVFFMSGMVARAQQKYQIAGNVTQAIIDQESNIIDNDFGHSLLLVKMEGVNYSTGEKEFMDGARIISVIFSDAEKLSATSQGYSKWTKKGDVVYFKIESKITTTLSEDGEPLTTVEGRYSSIKGSGQFENIRGSGTFKGRYISGYILTFEWEGEYWIEK